MSIFETATRRFQREATACLLRNEQTQKKILETLEIMMNLEIKRMTTLSEIAALAKELATTQGSLQVTEAHEIEVANAKVMDLQKQLDEAIAKNNAAISNSSLPPVDQAMLDDIGVSLSKALAIAKALNETATPPAPPTPIAG